jgi:hypothetical protein
MTSDKSSAVMFCPMPAYWTEVATADARGGDAPAVELFEDDRIPLNLLKIGEFIDVNGLAGLDLDDPQKRLWLWLRLRTMDLTPQARPTMPR